MHRARVCRYLTYLTVGMVPRSAVPAREGMPALPASMPGKRCAGRMTLSRPEAWTQPGASQGPYSRDAGGLPCAWPYRPAPPALPHSPARAHYTHALAGHKGDGLPDASRDGLPDIIADPRGAPQLRPGRARGGGEGWAPARHSARPERGSFVHDHEFSFTVHVFASTADPLTQNAICSPQFSLIHYYHHNRLMKGSK
jgi:hypothetical protein